EATPRQIACPSTPASIRAATVMSPLMPLEQSTWATFTVTGLLPAHSTGLVVQNPGKWYDDPQPGDHGLLMNDRPTAVELVAAARQYLERELIPTLSDARLRFQTLVAANVLSIVERELQTEEDHLLQERQWLAELLELKTPA